MWWTIGLLVALTLCLQYSAGIKWLGLVKLNATAWNNTKLCSQMKSRGMTSQQVALCRNNLELMPLLVSAATQAVYSCKDRFKERRWNCSSVLLAPRFNKDLTSGTREQAYVHALSSAAVAHVVSRSCATGALSQCNCGALPTTPAPPTFKWGGCSDNVRYGIGFSETFSDAPWLTARRRARNSKKATMNRHNNASGRKVVLDSLSTTCKCHGVSGSCSVKTCWRALPKFKSIAEMLMTKYGVAVEVKNERVGKKRHLVPTNRYRRSIRQDDLIYYTTSPDYCNPDKSTGSVGTKGRRCIKGSPTSAGCDSMCCGRGFKSVSKMVEERCNCKYIWCCYVDCDRCIKKVTEHTCW
ncbi:protein Wnt-11b-2 [Lingula anatina]|uniref:Protein Wnt n=1 Tax=Lingula anatina TaxID=7574 RepID=A0A1S3K5J0_LINAN|nr:protein Wnt-11b-2 [Lingula anatina]|eukprot:XP_013417895.1 protein Wnt-11b-2 [Lingula anatina]